MRRKLFLFDKKIKQKLSCNHDPTPARAHGCHQKQEEKRGNSRRRRRRRRAGHLHGTATGGGTGTTLLGGDFVAQAQGDALCL